MVEARQGGPGLDFPHNQQHKRDTTENLPQVMQMRTDKEKRLQKQGSFDLVLDGLIRVIRVICGRI